jgi:hypothetical protein
VWFINDPKGNFSAKCLKNMSKSVLASKLVKPCFKLGYCPYGVLAIAYDFLNLENSKISKTGCVKAKYPDRLCKETEFHFSYCPIFYVGSIEKLQNKTY